MAKKRKKRGTTKPRKSAKRKGQRKPPAKVKGPKILKRFTELESAQFDAFNAKAETAAERCKNAETAYVLADANLKGFIKGLDVRDGRKRVVEEFSIGRDPKTGDWCAIIPVGKRG